MKSVTDRRNRSGLVFLRSRMVRRGQGVLHESRPFLRDMRRTRDAWNKRFPEYLASGEVFPEGALPSTSFRSDGQFKPPELQRHVDGLRWNDDVEANRELARQQIHHNSKVLDVDWQWGNLTRQVRDLIFPPQWFRINVQWDSSHPANGVASAALLFDSRTVNVESLVPDLKAAPQYLQYPPVDVHEMDRLFEAEGQRNVLLEKLEAVLPPEEFDLVQQEARAAGVAKSREKMPHGMFVPNASDWWWYLPLGPDVRPEDLRRAASELPNLHRDIYGEAPFDQLVHELLDDGRSQSAVARLLGVSEDTVRRAKAARP